MARTKNEPARMKLPKTLPEGVSVQTQSRTLGTKPDGWTEADGNTDAYGKGIGIEVPFVEPTGEAVSNAIALLSQVGPGEQYGVEFAAAALNNAFSGVASVLTPATAKDSLTYLPTCSNPRYVDKAELAAAEFQRRVASGNPPTAAELAEIFADVIAK